MVAIIRNYNILYLVFSDIVTPKRFIVFSGEEINLVAFQFFRNNINRSQSAAIPRKFSSLFSIACLKAIVKTIILFPAKFIYHSCFIISTYLSHLFCFGPGKNNFYILRSM